MISLENRSRQLVYLTLGYF